MISNWCGWPKTRSVSTAKPTDTSSIVTTWPRDSLIHVYETVNSGTPGYNPIWYRVFGGYMHRARLQQVRIHYNVPLSSLPTPKVISEVTVPFTQAYRYNQWEGWLPLYRLYYSSTQWIIGIDNGPDGKAWYVVQDEADKNISYFVPAVQLRPISAGGILTPLSGCTRREKAHRRQPENPDADLL